MSRMVRNFSRNLTSFALLRNEKVHPMRAVLGHRYLCSNDSSKKVDTEREKDTVLLNSFHDKNPLEFLFTSEGLEQHIKNFDRRIISQVRLLNGVAISWALTNPLLKKYDFNAEDFLTGAEQALREVTKALVSRDLFEYMTNDKSTKSESAAFLSNVLYPLLYHNVTTSLRTNKFNNLPYRNLPADAIIHRSYIVDIHTYIVDDQVVEDRQANDKELQQLLDADVCVVPDGVEDESSVDQEWEKATRPRTFAYLEEEIGDSSTKMKHEALKMPYFPVGSVLTAVKVRFDCEFKMDEEEPTPPKAATVEIVSDDSKLDPPATDSTTPATATAAAAVDGEVLDSTAKAQTAEEPPSSSGSLGEDVEWAKLSNEEKVDSAGMAGTRSFEWVLIGCISGQVPLEYKVASFGVAAEQ